MNHNRAFELTRELELSGERTTLMLSRRMVVVRVETAFADRDRTAAYQFSNRVWIARGIEIGGVMRVDASGRKDETGMTRSNRSGALRRCD
jgi:hypothetical protein